MPSCILSKFSGKPVSSALLGGLLLVSASVLAAYLQIAPIPLMRMLLIAAVFFAWGRLKRCGVTRSALAVFSVFSLAISVTLVLGYHIHMEDRYFGTAVQNYITPYSAKDAAALLLMLPGLTVLFSALYSLIADAKRADFSACAPASGPRRRLLIFLALFLCYLPYLLVYWPGLVLNDTISSISQALEYTPLVNHHPVLYTLLIKLCMQLGEMFFASRTAGYALYTLAQMLYVCFCLSYIVDWVWRQARCRTPVGLSMIALFGLSPYFAAFSIAGWKDPAFSVSVAVLSVVLLDDAQRSEQEKSLRANLLYALLLLMVAFSRTNGVGVLVFVAVWQLARLLLRLRTKASRPSGRLTATLAALLIYFVVTGPVYDGMGVTTDKREANSLVLQQMARVAALDGDMSESDRAFLGELLPLELYAETYRPCCVDLLKWDEHFRAEAISPEIYGHWLSLFLKNPMTYFEAWELNTFGFWTLNVPSINSAEWNLQGGVIRNKLDPQYIANTYAEYGIEMKNLLGGSTLRDLLVTDEWFIPIGWIFWASVFLFLCMCLKGQFRLLGALVPTFGLMLPLIVFTPTCYWMRYGAALHDLLPVYLLLFSARRENQ